MTKYIIKRDGKQLAEVTDERSNFIAVVRWFHQHTGCSMDWALKYEGYSIEEVKN